MNEALYEQWQQTVLKAYNERNNTAKQIGDDNFDICEDGKVYEGNVSFDSGYVTWKAFCE